MSENSSGRDRKRKGKVIEWILSLQKEARARIWILGVWREGTLHRLSLHRSHCLMPASPAPSPAQLPAQMPVLLASSTSRGEDGDEDMGNGGTLLPSAPLPRRIAPLACSEVSARVRRSGGQVQQGNRCALSAPPYALPHPGPSHEVAALGSILVYLALGPGPPVRPARQLRRSLQSTA